MNKIAIFGAGKIGTAVYKMVLEFNKYHIYHSNSMRKPIAEPMVFDKSLPPNNINHLQHFTFLDVEDSSPQSIAYRLKDLDLQVVINCLPFFLNEKLAQASILANCHYIDFTEDDAMSEKVRNLYKMTNLKCITKCGLAPGFINYVGADLVQGLEKSGLYIYVGALPRVISNYSEDKPNYDLSWSVDGLVNEYIQPAKVKDWNKIQYVKPLQCIETVLIDGVKYESAITSGGVGTLPEDLENVEDVYYQTLRYPGHYDWVKREIYNTDGDFDKLKESFLQHFTYNDDIVIVTLAEACGFVGAQATKRTWSSKYYGKNGLSAIQATTAAGGVAILEMLIKGKWALRNEPINHKDISLEDFKKTWAFQTYYSTVPPI